MNNTNNSQIDPIKFGRTLEEAQRKNVNEQNDVDEQNDAENEKLNLIINFVETNGQNSFLAQSNSYVYDEDQHDIDQDDENQTEFIKEQKTNIKQYGTLKDVDDSQQFLQEHIQLVSEQVFHYLNDWSIQLQMEPDVFAMERISHQAMIIKFILELIADSNSSTFECIQIFFQSIRDDRSTRKKFQNKLNAFRESIDQSAEQKNQDLIQKEKQKEKRDEDATVNDEQEIDTEGGQ